LQERIRSQIRKNMPWPIGKVHLTFGPDPGEVVIPNVAYRIAMETRNDCDWKGTEEIQAVILKGDWEIKRVPMSVTFRVFGGVCVADKKIKRKSLISRSDLRIEEREITRFRDNLLFSMDDVIGKRAVRTIPSGRVLNDKMLEVPPLVLRGERVEIISRANNATVKVQGISKQDGCLGDEIRVRNPLTRRTIKATVCGEKTVSLSKY